MNACLPGLSPQTFSPHPLHHPDRCWPETNCFVDLWIELLHALGLPPEPALACTARQDFEGDQFGFFKIPLEDLEALYGLRVQELAIFDPPEVHLQRQIARGRLCMLEVDPYFLPDTAGFTYRLGHGKTTVGVNRIDPAARRLEYFHNAGYFALEAEDYVGVLRPDGDGAARFQPYTEFTTLEPVRLEPAELRRRAAELLARHWARRPTGNPIRRFQAALPAQAQALAERGPQAFHDFAFHNPRMLGANFELLGACLDWLSDGQDGRSRHCSVIAETAKAHTLRLARALARGGLERLAATLDPAAEAWDRLFAPAEALEAA